MANTTLITVVDVSGSTTLTGGPCGDANNDTAFNDILDCEVAAAVALNSQAGANGTIADVGAVVFGSSAAVADVSPALGEQALTGPTADGNSNSVADIEEVLRSVRPGRVLQFTSRFVSEQTNFEAAVQQASAAAATSSQPNKIVALLSDGTATAGTSAVDDATAAGAAGIKIFTFAVGTGSSCTDTGGGRGSLAQIAAAAGGTCTTVADPANLPDILPDIIGSELTSLSMTVNGGASAPITDVTPTLPQAGPASVAFATATDALGTGVHDICVTAAGSDAAGNGAVTDCHQVVVYDPDAGFVAGGGWIDSPEGAYTDDPDLTGKATFGFVSKYRKGATVPDGQTQFQFHAGGLNFHSSSYDWLVVAGSKAQYKGSGTINGGGDFGFMLTANDGQINGGGDVDRFRLKIWDKGSGNTIYDNQIGDSDAAGASDAIEGGSIVIHTGGKK